MKELALFIPDNKSDVLAIFSIILGIMSLILGVMSLIQSYRYNRDTEKIMKDIKLLLFQKNVQRNDTNTIRLKKDKIWLHKLCKYNKKDVNNIMDILNHLIIKKRFLDKIENFLKSDDIDYDCNFFGKAESDGEIDITKIYETLLKYNILVIIDRDS